MTDPFDRHRAEIPPALASDDPDEIKRLYVRLGAYLEAAAEQGLEVPVLSYPETAALVADHVPESSLILDAGCGPNPALALLLAQRAGVGVVALDIGEGTVRLAKRIAGAEGLSLLGVVGDVERLPFRSACFDVVVCDDTIEHLPHDVEGVKELARVLAPSGTAIAVTPNRYRLDSLAARARDLIARRRLPASSYYAAESHLREYSVGAFRSLLANGFLEVRMVPNGWPGGAGWRFASLAVRLPLLGRLSRLAFAIARRS